MRSRVLAFVLGLVMAAGCTLGEVFADNGDPLTLTSADLVGAWQSYQPRRELSFVDDGTFTAVNLPPDAFGDLVPDGFDPAEGSLDGSGEWTIDESTVTLAFRTLGGEPVRTSGPDLSAFDQGGVARLVFLYVGDGGNSWTSYER